MLVTSRDVLSQLGAPSLWLGVLSPEHAVRPLDTADPANIRIAQDPRQALRLIALAPGPEAGPEALTALDRSPPDPPSLDVLVRAHLIETGTSRGRWCMHDLVRAYGVFRRRADAVTLAEGHAPRARLLSRYERRVADSHSFLRLLADRPRGGEFANWAEVLRWLDTEREGLVGATQWAADPEHAATGVRFALSLCHYLV
ncbi:hypothetical protein ACWCQK_41535 [Streptomyces sp. NPDC002306]